MIRWFYHRTITCPFSWCNLCRCPHRSGNWSKRLSSPTDCCNCVLVLLPSPSSYNLGLVTQLRFRLRVVFFIPIVIRVCGSVTVFNVSGWVTFQCDAGCVHVCECAFSMCLCEFMCVGVSLFSMCLCEFLCVWCECVSIYECVVGSMMEEGVYRKELEGCTV